MPQEFRIPIEQLDNYRVVPEAPPPGQAQGQAPAPTSDGSIITGAAKAAGRGVLDFGIGAGKGLLDSVLSLGEIVDNPVTRGVGNFLGGQAARLMHGEEAVTPPVESEPAFSSAREAAEPDGAMQSAGKFIEQVGEFFIPANVARQAAIRGLVRLIPDSASPGAMKVMNKAGAIIGRTMGEAGSAAAVGSLQGDPDVDAEAAVAGAGPLLASGAQSLLANPTVQNMVAILLAGTPAGMVPSSLASRMGTFGLIRNLTQKGLENPATQRVIGRGITAGTRAVAGTSSQVNRERERQRRGSN